jgi:hypothetical protein
MVPYTLEEALMERVRRPRRARISGHERKVSLRRGALVVTLCAALLIAIGVWNAFSPAPGKEPVPSTAGVFTFVSTGIVFVDPATSEIVWRDTQQVSKRIGEDPWRNPDPQDPKTYIAWREHREIVGNPDHNIVTWVETIDGRRGDLVVVEANTGNVLARAPIQSPGNRSVVIAGVDDETVYYATPDPGTESPDMPSDDVWEWGWADGRAPRPGTEHAGRQFSVNDISAGVWAVYGAPPTMEFGDALTRRGSEARWPSGWTDFGGALSPNGEFWYAAGSTEIVETATGDAIDISAARERDYGWTGPAELTMTNPFVVCSAETGRCVEPAPIPVQGVCYRYGVVCGDHLPVN